MTAHDHAAETTIAGRGNAEAAKYRTRLRGLETLREAEAEHRLVLDGMRSDLLQDIRADLIAQVGRLDRIINSSTSGNSEAKETDQ